VLPVDYRHVGIYNNIKMVCREIRCEMTELSQGFVT
jgi:hypothetical protein